MGYPRTLPTAQIQEIISYFEKAPGVTLQSVIEDAYDVAGFALFSIEGSSHPLAAAAASHAQLAHVDVLKSALTLPISSIPWAMIWTIVQQLINEWIATK